MIVIACTDNAREVIPQFYLMLSVARQSIYSLVYIGIGTNKNVLAVVHSEDSSTVGGETEDTFQFGIMKFLSFGECVVPRLVITGRQHIFVARSIIVAYIIQLDGGAFVQSVLGSCTPVVAFVMRIIIISACHAVTFGGAVGHAPVISAVGIEREFFRSIVGELLRKVIHAVADGKLIEGFNQVIILVYGQATVLPAIRVIVFISSVRGELSFGNVQVEAL